MIELGNKAAEYGTLDTYAKKLHLNNEVNEIKKLKFLVSIFFLVWQKYYYQYNNVELKEKKRFQKVDSRYKSLISNLLEVNSLNDFPTLDLDVNFISWNYDFQIESTLSLFTKSGADLDVINLNYPFLPLDNNFEDMKILHLNGVSNFWLDHNNKIKLMFSDNIFSKNDSATQILLCRRIGEIYQQDYFPKTSTFINYSWDDDSNKIKSAQQLMKETDILIIIGYSFPTFNREIDLQLLSGKHNKFDKIVYQDPNTSAELLELFHINFRNQETDENGKYFDLKILKEVDQFYIPKSISLR